MKKEILVKDFQKWAIPLGYSWSGSADVWLGAYEFYKIDELRNQIKILEEEIKLLKDSKSERRDNE